MENFFEKMSEIPPEICYHYRRQNLNKGCDSMITVSQESIGGLFDLYADMVFRVAFGILRNREEAQDVVMDTFIALMKQTAFNDEGHIKAWLIRTAENKSINVVRSARVRHNVPLDEELENTLTAPAHDRDGEVLDMVLRLPDKLKSIIYMFYYEDMSASEIAQALCISEGTVYKRLERGRKALKLSIEEGTA